MEERCPLQQMFPGDGFGDQKERGRNLSGNVIGPTCHPCLVVGEGVLTRTEYRSEVCGSRTALLKGGASELDGEAIINLGK